MKRTSLWKRGIGLLLVSALLAAAAAALAGCGTDIIPSGTAQLGNLTEGLTPNKVTVNVDMDEQSVLITDFALRLLRASRHEGESTLVSPLSVLYALAMTANGAEGETKGQIESALGLRIEELNEYLYGYNVMLPQGWNSKIGIANSIWLNEAKQTSVKTDFLQANVDYLRADVYRVPFDDKTCADINGWVKEATDGLMPNMLDEVSSEAIVYLINALVFESPWFEPYKPEQVEPGVFTTEDDVTLNKLVHILINFHLEGMVGEVVDLRDGDIENARELVDLAFLVICEQLIVSSQAQVDFLHVLQSLSPPS